MQPINKYLVNKHIKLDDITKHFGEPYDSLKELTEGSYFVILSNQTTYNPNKIIGKCSTNDFKAETLSLNFRINVDFFLSFGLTKKSNGLGKSDIYFNSSCGGLKEWVIRRPHEDEYKLIKHLEEYVKENPGVTDKGQFFGGQYDWESGKLTLRGDKYKTTTFVSVDPKH